MTEIADRDSNQVAGGYAAEPSFRAQSSLFRPEAVAAQKELDWGRPVALMPLAWPALAMLLAAALSAAAVFLTTQTYARKETALGILRPEHGDTRVAGLRPGVVTALHIGEGASVSKGTPLATISTAQADSVGQIADEQVLAGIVAEEESLGRRLAALDASQTYDVLAVQAEVVATQAERQAAENSIHVLAERERLAADRVNAAKPLIEKGLIPVEEMRRREEALLAVKQALSDAHAKVAVLSARLDGLATKRARRPEDFTAARSQIEGQIAALGQRRAQAELSRGYVVRAPADGKITALQINLGQTIDPAKPLMTLSPIDGKLVAELYVPSRAIGFVKPGQKVRLLYEAFPYQRFGPAHGTVEATSATVLIPNEVKAPIALKEPVYRIMVRLDRQFMPAFGTNAPLQAGMALTADIVLEERSFAEWILEPLLAMRGRL
ncbi:MAG: HlyD family secretion protein [Caulobacterales bacterium]